MKNDFIITLAWPEGLCDPAGSWYDKFFAKNGKYRVGHSAIVLINSKTGNAHYFDFGRYHTPKGYGRVRDIETDGDLMITKAEIKNRKIINVEDILLDLSAMKSTHGEGTMYASILMEISFKKAFCYAKKTQEKGMLPYGPFVRKGTNCARFVSAVIESSGPSVIKKLRFRYPFCISPSPKRNVSITNHHYYIVRNNNCKTVKKNKWKAYFSSIEKW
tara:strand:- start:8894 stop:9544 length:651 start_codon:yes stop_codon:yes gene_type:complete